MYIIYIIHIIYIYILYILYINILYYIQCIYIYGEREMMFLTLLVFNSYVELPEGSGMNQPEFG